MNISKKKYQRVDKLETKKRMTDEEFNKLEIESEIINEQIQQANQIKEEYSAEVDKLPTMFQSVRFIRRSIENQELIPDELKGIFSIIKEYEDQQDWQLPFPILLLKAENKKTISERKLDSQNRQKIESQKTLSYLRQTKRNLRYALKNQPREKKVDFTPLGTIGANGISRPFKGNSQDALLNYGNVKTSQVYKNPIVQAFFEFSLKFSWLKHIELSFDEARRIFSRACKCSLGNSLETDLETKSFAEFLDFFYNGSGVFEHTDLSTYKPGRKPGKTEETKQIISLKLQNKSNRDISRELHPKWSIDDERHKSEGARIGRILRHYKHKKRQ